MYLAFDGEPGRPHYSGYWDLEPDGPPTALEEAPPSNSARTAVEWGRARTRRVFIRPDDWSGYFWAGVGDPPDDASIEGIYPMDSE